MNKVIERRNGKTIHRVVSQSGHIMYYVRNKNGLLSPNNPWNFLSDARKEADSNE